MPSWGFQGSIPRLVWWTWLPFSAVDRFEFVYASRKLSHHSFVNHPRSSSDLASFITHQHRIEALCITQAIYSAENMHESHLEELGTVFHAYIHIIVLQKGKRNYLCRHRIGAQPAPRSPVFSSLSIMSAETETWKRFIELDRDPFLIIASQSHTYHRIRIP